jgi:hypothetical protein
MNGTTKRTPNSIWKEGHELQGEQDRATIRRHEQRIINAVKNNGTTEYKVGDFVRVKMGTLFSSVRKLLKSGDRKNVVVNYSPTVYKITNILDKDKPDRRVGNNTIEYEKSKYTLSNLDGTILQTQLKKNNPNAVRKSKRFFASDMQLVNDPEEEDTYLKDFTIQDALKLNKMDKRNDIAIARALPRPQPIVRAVLPIPIRIAPPIRPPIAVVENLVGQEVENTFGGFGRRLFVGKIMSYDKDNKKYTVKYADGYEQEYTLTEIKKHLKREEQVANVRPQRDRRQIVIGGAIHYL